MVTEKLQPKIERMKLQITEAKEPIAVGDKGTLKKVFFARREGSNEDALPYFTFRNTLFDKIKTGITIEADVETSSREWGGNAYTDRKVSQIYEGGQPVAQHSAGSGGQRAWGKSPETLALEHKNEMEIEILTHVSIEKQVAVKELGEGLRMGLFKPDGVEMTIYRETLWGMLQSRNPPTPSTNPSSPVQAPTPISQPRPVGTPASGPQTTVAEFEALGKVKPELGLNGAVSLAPAIIKEIEAELKRVGEDKKPMCLAMFHAEKFEQLTVEQATSLKAQLKQIKAK